MDKAWEVECVDRATGAAYTVDVWAGSATEAVEKAARHHVAGTARLKPIVGGAPERHASDPEPKPSDLDMLESRMVRAVTRGVFYAGAFVCVLYSLACFLVALPFGVAGLIASINPDKQFTQPQFWLVLIAAAIGWLGVIVLVVSIGSAAVRAFRHGRPSLEGK